VRKIPLHSPARRDIPRRLSVVPRLRGSTLDL
jgi:hypothetical protein